MLFLKRGKMPAFFVLIQFHRCPVFACHNKISSLAAIFEKDGPILITRSITV